MFSRAIVSACAVAVAFAAPTEFNDVEVQDLWANFKETHSKSYSAVDESVRLAVFRDNLRLAAIKNSESATATYGVTKFMDLTPEEFRSQMLMRKGSKPRSFLPLAVPRNATAPLATSVDWTTKGAVTPVKDQGNCGSCWSFGTTGAIEGVRAVAGDKKLEPLSEQQLVSCDKTDGACNGGLQADALDYVIKTGGIQSEAAYPYTSGKGRVAACNVDKSKFVTTVASWQELPEGDETALAQMLQQNWPITIGINADDMQYYRNGVTDPNGCANGYYDLDHAVLMVGFGTDNGVDYWKVKNSWATDWGEDGYYRIIRGKNSCGVATDSQIAFV